MVIQHNEQSETFQARWMSHTSHSSSSVAEQVMAVQQNGKCYHHIHKELKQLFHLPVKCTVWSPERLPEYWDRKK